MSLEDTSLQMVGFSSWTYPLKQGKCSFQSSFRTPERKAVSSKKQTKNPNILEAHLIWILLDNLMPNPLSSLQGEIFRSYVSD